MAAKGLGGSYGADTGNHPARRPSPPPTGGLSASDFGGGDFPKPTPTSPPQSERPGRGTLIDPNKAEYAPVTGSPGRYYTPDRLMTVGIGRRVPASPPLSEQRGRGILASPTPVGTLQRFPSPDGGLVSVQPMPSMSPLQSDQRVSNFGPVGDFINKHQMTAS